MSVGPIFLLLAVGLLLAGAVVGALVCRLGRAASDRSSDDCERFQREWQRDRDALYVSLVRLENSMRSVEAQLQKSVTPSAPSAPFSLLGPNPYEPIPSGLPPRKPGWFAERQANGLSRAGIVEPAYGSFAEVRAARLAREATLEEEPDDISEAAHVGHA